MTNLKELKTQIEAANALGEQKLLEKGIVPLRRPGVTGIKPPTTYDIMESIGFIQTGGSTLNIAYGETPPEDTSKLWIKANEPANVKVNSDIEGVESIASVGYLPKATSAMGSARVGNKIYLFGGWDSGTYFNTINVFDTKTETITVLDTTLPSSVGGMGCASVGTKIYMFGGYDGGYSPYIWVFDTETETIAELSATLPNGVRNVGCASVGTKIYLFGGQSSGYLNTINVFDTETETITTVSTTLPKAISAMGCSAIGTKIYLLGGGGASTRYSDIYVFDTETQTITQLGVSLPIILFKMGYATIGTKIYLFGGFSSGTIKKAIYVFDTETQTITQLAITLPYTNNELSCASYGNKVYLFGGYSSESNSYLNTITCFTLTHELAQGDIEIQNGLVKNKFNLINTDNAQLQIGVENVYIGNENNEAESVEAYLHDGADWVQI